MAIMDVLMWLNAVVFLLLASVHVYWALGGVQWLNLALPQTEQNQQPVFMPGRVACLVVVLVLVAFAGYSVATTPFFHLLDRPHWGNAFLGAIFCLRAMGDFKYVGITKKIKHTPFAQMDTQWYVPLCLYLGISNLVYYFWVAP